MSLTALEKELLGYVKALSEASTQSVNISKTETVFLAKSLNILVLSQGALLDALNELAKERANYEEVKMNLLKAGQKLKDVEKRLKELSET